MIFPVQRLNRRQKIFRSKARGSGDGSRAGGSGKPQVCSRRTIQQEINFHGFHDLQPSGPCAASSSARLRRSRPIREGDRAAKAISSWCNRFYPCSIHSNPGHVARPSLPHSPLLSTARQGCQGQASRDDPSISNLPSFEDTTFPSIVLCLSPDCWALQNYSRRTE